MSDEQPLPLALLRPSRRDTLATLLNTSARTIQRRVKSGDIERIDHDSGVPLYRCVDTAWSREQGHDYGRRWRDRIEGDVSGDMGDTEEENDNTCDSTGPSGQGDTGRHDMSATEATSRHTEQMALGILEASLEQERGRGDQLAGQVEGLRGMLDASRLELGACQVELARSQTALVHVTRERDALTLALKSNRSLWGRLKEWMGRWFR